MPLSAFILEIFNLVKHIEDSYIVRIRGSLVSDKLKGEKQIQKM